jgi:phospholipase D1/2
VHPNIAVFRHPDHAPSGQVIESEIMAGLKNFSFKTMNLSKLPEDGLKALYGFNDDIILYWAHHEKLCLIDGKMAFMGGLDLCFGRWDSYSHPIADAHPTDVDEILFPGQDYNNARIYDFEDVSKYDQNKLKRTESSRMGWSDLSMCIQGAVVEDLRAHFVQRWNFIYWEKYDVRNDSRYHALSLKDSDIPDHYYHPDGKAVRRVRENDAEDEDREADIQGFGKQHHFHLPGGTGSIYDKMREALPEKLGGTQAVDLEAANHHGGMSVQLVRSCTRWSNGCPTEVGLPISHESPY